jgi:NADH-quinone oxidoreductase subunit N
MFDAPSFADLNLEIALPVLFLSGFTMILLLVDLFIPDDRKVVTARLAASILAVTFVLNLIVMRGEPDSAFNDMFVADRFTGFVNLIVLIVGMLSILIGHDYQMRTNIRAGEVYSLMLFSISGMMLMGSANDLIVVFIALELLSIPLYVLSAIRPKDIKAEESGIKYFIMGAFASAFFVYGAALVYGATGTTNLREIFAVVSSVIANEGAEIWYLVVGVGLLIVSLGFKVAVVPFHMWTPDVYEGAPTSVTAFMSVGAKTGGFAALLRISLVALPAIVLETTDTHTSWQFTVALIAAVTMILGNIAAVSQTNVKRLLAYSSIAHAGYIMMAVAAIGTLGIAVEDVAKAALVYLLAYAFTNLGAFAVVIALEKNDTSGTDLDAFNGLANSKPLMALIMAVFMLSLTGIPLTGGFIGKFLIFDMTIKANLEWLAVVGVLTSVVSAFYYVRIIVNMYLREGEGDAAEGETPALTWGLMAAFAGTLLLGIFPVLATNMLDGMTLAITTIF